MAHQDSDYQGKGTGGSGRGVHGKPPDGWWYSFMHCMMVTQMSSLAEKLIKLYTYDWCTLPYIHQ